MGDLPLGARLLKSGTVPAFGLGPFRRFQQGCGVSVVNRRLKMFEAAGRDV
jgi:hypothetical protein